MPEPLVDNRPIAGVIHTNCERIRSWRCKLVLEEVLCPCGPVATPTPKKQRSDGVISFFNVNAEGVQTPHDDAIVVSMTIANYDVKRILVDNGSSVDILFYDAFSKMNLPVNLLRKTNSLLVGFSEDVISVEGIITLPVTKGQTLRQVIVMLDFPVVKVALAYNAILARPSLNAL